MICDHEWNGAEVQRNFGVLQLSFPTFRRIHALRNGDFLVAWQDWMEYVSNVTEHIPVQELITRDTWRTDKCEYCTVRSNLDLLWHLQRGAISTRPQARVLCRRSRLREPDISWPPKRLLSAQQLFAEFLQRLDEVKEDADWGARISRCLIEAHKHPHRSRAARHEAGRALCSPAPCNMSLVALVSAMNDYCSHWCNHSSEVIMGGSSKVSLF